MRRRAFQVKGSITVCRNGRCGHERHVRLPTQQATVTAALGSGPSYTVRYALLNNYIPFVAIGLLWSTYSLALRYHDRSPATPATVPTRNCSWRNPLPVAFSGARPTGVAKHNRRDSRGGRNIAVGGHRLIRSYRALASAPKLPAAYSPTLDTTKPNLLIQQPNSVSEITATD